MPCSSSGFRKDLLVIGGGVIGLEFATVYTRLGAKVLVVEMLPQILTGTDLEICKTLGRILKKQGVEIMLNTKVGTLEKNGEDRQEPRSTARGRAIRTKRASSIWCSSRSDAVPSPIIWNLRTPDSPSTRRVSSP